MILIVMDNLHNVQVFKKYNKNIFKTLNFYLEPINPNLCNGMYCGDGVCIVTSRNLTYCRCSSGIIGTNCDQRM
jgi:hypothetical protein